MPAPLTREIVRNSEDLLALILFSPRAFAQDVERSKKQLQRMDSAPALISA